MLNKNLLKLFFMFVSLANDVMAENYYIIEHKSDLIHITACFNKRYQLNELYIPSKIWNTDYSAQIVNLKSTERACLKCKNEDFVNSDINTIIEYDLINIPQDQYLEFFPDNYNHYIEKNKFFLHGMGAFVRPDDIDPNSEATIKVNSSLGVTSNIKNHFKANSIKVPFKALSDVVILGGATTITSDSSSSSIVTLNIKNNYYTQIAESVQNSSKKFNTLMCLH